MKIVHKLSFATGEEVSSEVSRLGLKVSVGSISTIFEIEEGDPRWPEVSRWAAEQEALDTVSTKFDDTELAAAEWLKLSPDWHHGYPQPKEDSFGFLEATYDLTDFCRACGMGLVQNAPFQMKGEPKWGRRQILQMNWVFDQYFVTPQAWEEVFAPLGIPKMEVLNRKLRPLETVVQLVIDQVVHVDPQGLPTEHCHQCGQTKYNLPARGPFPEPQRPTGITCRTDAWFGSGALAFRPECVHQQVRQAMIDHAIKGASFYPADRDSNLVY